MLTTCVKVRFIICLILPCLIHFLYSTGKLYECGGVAMGFPLGRLLANIFMCHFKNIRQENSPPHYKPIVYKRFAADRALLFQLEHHTEKNYRNKHKNIKFTSEIEENDSFSFMDITISSENNKFVTSIYPKSIFTDIFTNFKKFTPDEYKRGLIETLLHRSFRLCSNYENVHRESKTLKSIFKHNNYPKTSIIIV